MSVRHTYRVDIAYAGQGFVGFAQQPGARTVEGEIVRALVPLIPDLRSIDAGGRTDKGVNATGQVVSFWHRARLEPERIEAQLAAALPEDIAILAVREVPRWFHARFTATFRRYVYFLPAGTIDVERLDRMLGGLVGRRCFRAFSRSTPRDKCTIRRVLEARARPDGDQIRIDIAGTSFLRQMVRVTVATALREVEAKSEPDALVRLAESGDREQTAYPADPSTLYLAKVAYEPFIPRKGRS